MTDILVSICVGAAGLYTCGSFIVVLGSGRLHGLGIPICLGAILLGLITILRALGVL